MTTERSQGWTNRVERALAGLIDLAIPDRASPRAKRRLQALNVMWLCTVPMMLCYAAFYFAVWTGGFWILGIAAVLSAALFASTPLFNRYSEPIPQLWFCFAWLATTTSIGWALGSAAGIHFFYFPGAAQIVFFGFRRTKLSLALSAVTLALFLWFEFTGVAPADFIKPDIQLLGVLKIVNIVNAFTIILIALVYSAWLANRAEDLLASEFGRSERLLENILPESIAKRLKDRPETVIADNLRQVTILFADIVNFTPRAARMSAPDVIDFLNRIFTAFDRLADRHGLEKIKTIGDAYMVAGGMPKAREDHAAVVAAMALDMLAEVERISQELGETVTVRVGVHTGPAVAGVIGTRKFFYDVWGDTVNTAARLESSGLPGRIQISEETREAIGPAFETEPRGTVLVKGKGKLRTWWLTGRTR